MVLLWAWGTISPQLLQHLMSLFLIDVGNAKVLKLDLARRLAELSTSGAYAQKMRSRGDCATDPGQVPTTPASAVCCNIFLEQL